MSEFEIIDHTADVGIIARGESVEEVFINAARGMFSLIIDLDTVVESTSQEITVDAPDQEELLITWLNELLYLFDAENLIFSRFEITYLGQEHLKGIVYGEEVDPDRHNLKSDVKAATYHMIRLQKQDGFSAHIILDI
ncbi:MAG: archease [Chloroflexi bacterium]|jgi:SHS2 domain-containing protein|nr:archease [Chloroflexota bacterium]